MNQTVKRILFSAMAMVLLLSACAPAPAPTQDPALVQQLIEQSVQLTVAAQNLETAQAVPPATETPLPTATEVVSPTPTALIPTATPFVVVPPTAVVSGGSGGTTIKPDMACDIIRQRPIDDSVFRPGDEFDVEWTFVNTGRKSWRDGLDIKYVTGPQMTNVTIVELPALDPGDQYEVVLDATAPMETGQQIMVWSLEDLPCTPYVRIIVKK